MGKENTGTNGSSDGFHRILFMGPKSDIGIGHLAEKLVNMGLFEDLSVENRKNGYVARVKFFPGREPKRLSEYIAKNVDRKFGEVVKA